MVSFQHEKFAATYSEAQELLRLHWEEIAPYKDVLWLNPDLDFYNAADAKGALHVITARDKERLVGYIALLLNRHLHYKHALIATDDIHFLHPNYRKGSLGTRLLVEAEKAASALGADIMVLRAKAAKNHGPLFERLGFTALDVSYAKRLKK